jgi:hypothetical protein
MIRLSACLVILGLIGLVHWWSAPRNGEYWWPDSSRHMLNAVFVKDALVAFPRKNPMAWAEAYYDQYPGLTIGFYPPGFAGLLGILFLATGASHAVAQAFLTSALLLLALSTAIHAKSMVGAPGGVVAATLLLTAPELLTWSRQVQPEVPAMMLAMSAVALARIAISRKSLMLSLSAAAIFVGALYCKQTVIVLSPLMAWAIWPRETARANALRWGLMHAAFAGLLFVPLGVFQLQFGRENLRSIQGIPDIPHQVWEFENWTWYASHLVNIAGWPLIIATGIGMAMLICRRDRHDKVYAYVLIVLFLWIYAVFSIIALKEQRHILPILLPMSLFAGLGIGRLLQATRVGWAGAAALMTWATINAYGFTPPRTTGPEAAAAWIIQVAPHNCTVLVHAAQDGSFITNIRISDVERRCTVLRSDKLLFEVTIRRELGISERSLRPEDLRALFFELGVRYVVIDPSFWDDLSNSRMLVSTVQSSGFVKHVQFPLTTAAPGQQPKERSTIEIYENIQSVSESPMKLRVKPSL